MSFASLIFFLYLPLVFFLYWLIPRKAWQNSILVLASYLFYGWWDWRFCFLMLGSSLIDYLAGLGLQWQFSPNKRKAILIAALTGNLLILGFFKYFNFFVDSLAISLAVLGLDFSTSTLQVILPVGISFYTFQTMGYTLDVYWRRLPAKKNLLDYLTFVSFFPQLVAGPIERAGNLLPQFQTARSFSEENAAAGGRLILWGLAKKMLVADNLGRVVELAFHNPENMGGAALALATVAFGFQIYCDFSGYSDIAVGTGRLFGIQLMRNFAFPYFSQSITEFWRRWHISLSTWFRDYVYVPLGGNREGRMLLYRNLFLTAVLSGLWHGAAWHFVVWGGLHGIYLIGERILGLQPQTRSASESPGGISFLPGPKVWCRMASTFFLVSLAWVFFRAETIGEALLICGQIGGDLFSFTFYREFWEFLSAHSFPFALLGCFVLVEWLVRHWDFPSAGWQAPLPLRWVAYIVVFWAILLFGTQRTQEFIYFQF